MNWWERRPSSRRARRRRTATALALAAIAGLVATAASVDITAASWSDRVDFAAQVAASTTTTSTTTSTTSTTTTLPPTTTSTTTTSTTSTTTTTLPPTPSGTTGGITEANPNTVISDLDWTFHTARQTCTVVSVTGIDQTPRHWALRVDLTAAPWNGTPANRINLNGTGTLVIESPTSMVITGRTHGGPFNPRTNNTPLTASQTAQITICDYNSPVPPPADPDWYTVTTTRGEWTDTTACVTATISTTLGDLEAFPFFYGWTTVIDLTAAKARIADAGRTINFVSWSPHPNGDTHFAASSTSYHPPADTYTLTSGFNTALRADGDHDSTSITACVRGY